MTDAEGFSVALLLLLLSCAVVAQPRGCGAYPPPVLDDAVDTTGRVTLSVTADDAGASTCAQMSTDDVMWQLLDAEHAGRTVRFVGCVEVVP